MEFRNENSTRGQMVNPMKFDEIHGGMEMFSKAQPSTRLHRFVNFEKIAKDDFDKSATTCYQPDGVEWVHPLHHHVPSFVPQDNGPPNPPSWSYPSLSYPHSYSPFYAYTPLPRYKPQPLNPITSTPYLPKTLPSPPPMYPLIPSPIYDAPPYDATTSSAPAENGSATPYSSSRLNPDAPAFPVRHSELQVPIYPWLSSTNEEIGVSRIDWSVNALVTDCIVSAVWRPMAFELLSMRRRSAATSRTV